jgi:hypothetical protein
MKNILSLLLPIHVNSDVDYAFYCRGYLLGDIHYINYQINFKQKVFVA